MADAFVDLHGPLSEDAAFAEAQRCLYCYDAPCTKACPTHIDVPAFIRKIGTGNLRGAARVILDANPLGYACARVCPVQVLCEGACVMHGMAREPIAIGRLQRHATEAVVTAGLQPFAAGSPTGKRVAVVGGGPAGLAAARDLRRLGHGVVLFEAGDALGGLNRTGVAQYKLRPELAIAEARTIISLGVEVRLGTPVGTKVSWDELLAAHDAVLVAVGLGGTGRLGVPGDGLPGVLEALSLIETMKLDPGAARARLGRRVVVVGCGNTAIDAATQARLLGAEAVTLVYRRGEADAPAYPHERAHARSVGVELRFWTAPTRVRGGERVEGLECVRTEAEAHAGGRRAALREVAGSAHVLAAETIVVAVGQERRAALFEGLRGVALEGGRPVVDAVSGRTSHPKVFAAGDCANGGREVVHAVAEGRRAAAGIDAMLREGEPRGR